MSHFVQLWHQQMKQMHEIFFSIREMKKGQKKRKTIESVPITSTFQKKKKERKVSNLNIK